MGKLGGRGCETRRARARSMARFVVAPLVLALCLFGMVRTAYAEVDWHEKNDTMSATVSPWNYPDGRVYALAEFLGYDWGSLSVDVQESILTDSNGDNAFAMMLDHDVLNVQYESGDGTLNWPIINLWSQLFGLDKCWDISVTRTRYNQARDVMKKWMFPRTDEGGGSGGGGSGGEGSVTGTLYANDLSGRNGARVYEYDNGVKGAQKDYMITANPLYETCTYVSEMNLVTNEYYDETINELMSTFDNPMVLVRAYGYSSNVNVQLNIIIGENIEINEEGTGYTCDGPYKYLNTYSGERYFGVSGDTYYLVLHPTSMAFRSRTTATGTFSDSSYSAWMSYADGGEGGEGGGGGDYTPTPKPDPTRPEGPEIHLPDINIEPTIYDYGDPSIHIDVQLPSVTVQPDFSVDDDDWDISVNVNLDPVVSVSGGGSDVTSWLSKILEAINNLRQENRTDFNWLRELNTSNTNILRNGLDDFDTDVIQGMGLMYDYMATMNSDIHDDLDAVNRQIQKEGMYITGELKEAMHGRFEWLAENINQTLYDFDDDMLKELHTQAQYIVDNLEFDADNSKLEEWLKKIYAKLSKNPSGIPDVTTDPDGWTDALEDLIRKLLEGLVGAANVAELAQMLNDLSNRFPISIPWDLLAIVTLFSGEPVTPQFDFPIYFGSQHITDISVDLTPYEDVASVSRKMSLLLFACMLLMETKTLLNATTTVTRKAA